MGSIFILVIVWDLPGSLCSEAHSRPVTDCGVQILFVSVSFLNQDIKGRCRKINTGAKGNGISAKLIIRKKSYLHSAQSASKA